MGADLGAVLMECPVFAAEESMDELVELGLLAPGVTGRYQFHDLLRLFARERLHADEPTRLRTPLRDRMVASLLATTSRAGRFFGSADTEPSAADAVVVLGTRPRRDLVGAGEHQLARRPSPGCRRRPSPAGDRHDGRTSVGLRHVGPVGPVGRALHTLGRVRPSVVDQPTEAEHLYHLAVVLDSIVSDDDELGRVVALLTALSDELGDPGLRGRALMARCGSRAR